MAKAKRKTDKRVERRAKATPVNVPGSKLRYHRPGSQNKNK